MVGRFVLVAAVAFVSVLSLGSARAQAIGISDDHAQILVTTSPGMVALGGSMVVDVYTYYDGIAADTDENITAYLDIGSRPPSLGPFEHVSVGHYRTTVDVPGEEPYAVPGVPLWAGLHMFTRIHGHFANGVEFLSFRNPGPLLKIKVNNTIPWPGQSLRVEVELLDAGQPVDGMGTKVSVGANSYTNPLIVDASRNGVGLYSATVTIPAYRPAAEELIVVRANTTYHGVNVSGVSVLDAPRYQVWFHSAQRVASMIPAEVWIADAFGRPAVDLRVNLSVNGMSSIASTDERGSIPVTLDFSGTDSINVYGTAAPGTFLETYFFGTATRSGVVERIGARPLDPAVMADGGLRDFLTAGEKVTRRFQLAAYDGTNRWQRCSDANVSFYIQTIHAVVAAGHTRTDANGTFSISFLAPSDFVSAAFVSGGCDSFYAWNVQTTRIHLDVPSLLLGSASPLTMTVDPDLQEAIDQSDFSSVWSSPTAGQIDLLASPSGETWQRWTFPFVTLFREGDARTRTVYMPSFLPENATYLAFVSGFADSDRLIHFRVLTVGEPQANGVFWIAYLALILVTLPGVALVVVLVWLRRRSARRPPTEGPPRTS